MIKNRISRFLGIILSFSFILAAFTGCYSVFSGGTGGLVVDAESTSNPKAGIANVDVYAYMSSGDRDNDFNKWKEGTTFTPSGYYGHTTTAADGTFTISKLVWKEYSPDFGRDADCAEVYLLFYHENYGLTKGQTVIVSDSSSDTVYAELTSVRKSTILNLNFVDVATGNNTNHGVYVKVSVPQATEANQSAEPKIYDGVITGTGAITVTYPRSISEPTVTVSYVQSGDEITWKGCYNGDNEEKNYAFRDDAATGISRVIKNPSYVMNFYGKSTKLNVPTVNGQYGTDTSADDGLVVTMHPAGTTDDLGQVTTYAQTLGTSGTEKHGTFSGLGNGYTWTDTSYTGKYTSIKVDIKVSGADKKSNMELRSDISSYTVQLN